MKWPPSQVPPVSGRLAVGVDRGDARGAEAMRFRLMSTELSQSSIRARGRIGWSPSAGRNRNREVEEERRAVSSPEAIVRDHRR